MKAKQLSAVLRAMIVAHEPVLIKGAPGVGKTDIVAQACAAEEADLVVMHPVVSDPTDFKGLPFATVDGKAVFLPFGELLTLIEADRLTVCFLDDLGQAAPAVQAACMQLVLARRINGHAVSKHVTFAAATNRKEDRSGVSGILEAVKSRFTILELTPDVEDWCNWALDHGVPSELVAFVRYRPDLLFDFKPSPNITNGPSPRTVAALGRLVKIGFALEVETEVFTGAVGQGFAIEFVAFAKLYRNMVAPEAILLSPETAPIPAETSMLYAITVALARLADKENFGAVVAYGKRLPKEFEVSMVVDTSRCAPGIKTTKVFTEWCCANAGVIV